jgi:hypothetical protein
VCVCVCVCVCGVQRCSARTCEYHDSFVVDRSVAWASKRNVRLDVRLTAPVNHVPAGTITSAPLGATAWQCATARLIAAVLLPTSSAGSGRAPNSVMEHWTMPAMPLLLSRARVRCGLPTDIAANHMATQKKRHMVSRVDQSQLKCPSESLAKNSDGAAAISATLQLTAPGRRYLVEDLDLESGFTQSERGNCCCSCGCDAVAQPPRNAGQRAVRLGARRS